MIKLFFHSEKFMLIIPVLEFTFQWKAYFLAFSSIIEFYPNVIYFYDWKYFTDHTIILFNIKNKI